MLLSCRGKRQLISQIDEIGQITIVKHFKKNSESYLIELTVDSLKNHFFETIKVDATSRDFAVVKYTDVQNKVENSTQYYSIAVTTLHKGKYYWFDKEIECNDMCVYNGITVREKEAIKLYEKATNDDLFARNHFSDWIIGFLTIKSY